MNISCKFIIYVISSCIIMSMANAQNVTLTISHFLSPKSQTHAKFIEPWAKQVEKESQGRLKFEIFPSMTLGGNPTELYSQLRDGVADIIWTLPGYTAGIFPRAEVFEIAAVHQNSAYATTMAIQDSFDLIREDFKYVKPILIHAHAGNALHLRNGCINTMNDLSGFKLRTPSRTGGWHIIEMGAEPVGMPVPSVPQALSKGNIDGALLPFDIVPALKVQDLTKCSITGQDNYRFGTAIFMFAMNKDSYNNLPSDLKKIIDNNSGKNIAAQIGKRWDNFENPGYKLQLATGSKIMSFNTAQTKIMKQHANNIAKKWVDNAKKEGIDNAQEILNKARIAVQKYIQ